MNKVTLRGLVGICSASLAYCNVAFADDAGIAIQTTPAGIEYASGGIGEDEQADMGALSRDFNLQLTFARPKSGDSVVDVAVVVENARHEKVLDLVSTGPQLFAKLPAGKYVVTADAEGQPQTRQAAIAAGHPHGMVFYFPERN